MTLKPYDLEVGPVGTPLTAANTGANQVAVNGGGTLLASQYLVAHGTVGAMATSGSTGQTLIRTLAASTTNLTLASGLPFAVLQTPLTAGTPTWFQTLRNNGAYVARVQWTNTNQIVLTDGSGANSQVLVASATVGQPYFVTIRATAATTTTGQLTVRVFDRTATLVGSFSSTTWNLGTTALFGSDIGIVNTNSAPGTQVAFDYPQFNDGSTTEITPIAMMATSGSSSGTGSGSGTTTVSLATGGASAGAGSAAGTLAVTLSTSGAATGTGDTIGAVSIAALTSGSGAGAGSTSGSTTVALATSGAASGAGIATGAVTIQDRPPDQTAGSASGSGSTSAAVTVTLGTTGSGWGTGATSAALSVALTTSGAGAGTGTATGQIVAPERDITVTATLGSRRWSGQTRGRDKRGIIGARRYGGSL